MRKSAMKQIRDRIDSAESGSMFIYSDFSDIASADTVRQNVCRLAKVGFLRRVLDGVYEKPRYSGFLHEYLETNISQVAKALARNYHWTIAPDENHALNMLGLDTQVPAHPSYISDGAYHGGMIPKEQYRYLWGKYIWPDTEFSK